jgi:hypothetical protein
LPASNHDHIEALGLCDGFANQFDCCSHGCSPRAKGPTRWGVTTPGCS